MAVSLALGASGCSQEMATDRARARADTARLAAAPGTETNPQLGRRERIRERSIRIWRRGIPSDRALALLQRHVDVPVVAPSLLRGLWTASRKYIDWARHDGLRVGSVELRHRDQILHISYGAAGFDGCGGDSAIQTKVLGRRALVSTARGALWSTLIWPVAEGETTGRYGLSGTFEPAQLLTLAESMELQRLEAAAGAHQGC